MRAEAKSSAIWAIPLAVLALAAACFWFDPGGWSARLTGLESHFFRHFQPGDIKSAAPLSQILLLSGAGVLLIFVLLRAGKLWGSLFFLLLIGAVCGGGWYAFSDWHRVIGAAGVCLALALAFAGALIGFAISTARTRAILRRSFAGIFPESVIEKIARNPSLFKDDGEGRTVTLASCSLHRNAVPGETITEPAADFIRRIDKAMSSAIAIALERDATIGPVSGDGFSVYWNAPLDDREQAIHACDAALSMAALFSADTKPDGASPAPLVMETGIATSVAVAGIFNANGRKNYGVIGDCANIAEAMRKISSDYGYPVIVDDDTRALAEQGFALLEVDFIALGSRGRTIKLFAVLGNLQMRSSPKFRALRTFHDHIFQFIRTQQWDQARMLIAQARNLSSASQKLYDLHLKRIDAFEKNPPGADWDGAYRPFLK